MEQEPEPIPPRGRRARPPARANEAGQAATMRWMRRISIGAAVIALLALGLSAWRFIVPAGSACQSTAWSATPAKADLPSGWSIGATQFDPDRLSMTLPGPVPADQTLARPVIYVTVTCYASGAADAVTRAQDATSATGATVAARTDLGDQGYSAVSASGATFIQFRHGSVVTYVAASGTATAADVEAVASAFDRKLGGNGSAASLAPVGSASPAAAAPSASPAGGTIPPSSGVPSSSAAAPELEAALPTTVSGTTMTISSAVGTTVLGTDAGSRAITAALNAASIPISAFQVAQAYDPTNAIDLTITDFRIVGMDTTAVRKIVLDTWLSATGTGVTTTTTTVGGRAATKVDYGDGGATPYVLEIGGIVYVINTKTADLATAAAAALPAG